MSAKKRSRKDPTPASPGVRVLLVGTNYVGAHFRGIPCDYDDRVFRVVLLADEEVQVVAYCRENLAYAMEEDRLEGPQTLVAYAELLKDGSEPQWDGCGGVIKLQDLSGNPWTLFEEDLDDMEEECRPKVDAPLDLGEVDLRADAPTINDLVKTAVRRHDSSLVHEVVAWIALHEQDAKTAEEVALLSSTRLATSLTKHSPQEIAKQVLDFRKVGEALKTLAEKHRNSTPKPSDN